MAGKTIDDAYAVDDQVMYQTFWPGSSVYALVAAAAPAIADGDWLTVAADGTLAKAAAGDIVLAQAREAIDNSAGEDPVRIKAAVTACFTL